MISDKLKLDDIDRRIITLVQEDPNLTHTQIAEKINRSQPTVGMRIKKLEKEGILQFQPGINFKRVDLFLASVELNTKRPNEILDMARFCPFMLNAFRLSGSHNICILFFYSSRILNNQLLLCAFPNQDETWQFFVKLRNLFSLSHYRHHRVDLSGEIL